MDATSFLSLAEIVQRDDGWWSIGLSDDAPGPFETWEFAMSVRSYVSPAAVPRFSPQRSGARIANPRS
ncbi:hypothetical protein V1281_001779 [Nitrobacteraceae bacterium AZCC 2161]